MRYALICPIDLLEHLVEGLSLPGEAPVFLVERPTLRTRLARLGHHAVAGNLDDPAFYLQALKGSRGPAVIGASPRRLARVAATVAGALPDIPLLAVTADDRPVPGVTTVPLAHFGDQMIRPALDRACIRSKVDRIRAQFEGAERVLILMQDDPDPDAIASAFALKALFGRSTSAPLCTFGTITRPENVAMCKILEIEVEQIDAREVAQFDRIALVDVQPSFLEEPLGDVDLVIDHHPVEQPIKAHMKDVRPSYGATSTILVEYLRAADVKISQRLATALLYGIKSDTLGLERGGTRADLDAFSYLYLLANHNALRRIERPDLSEAALDALALGLSRRRIVRGVFFSHLGRVVTVDQIPQFADFGLQAEGVEWSVVSGIVGDDVHISVRNVGYVRSAGDVVRAAFGDVGSAGGHRTMAKAVVSLERLVKGGGEARPERRCANRIVRRFLRALAPNGRG